MAVGDRNFFAVLRGNPRALARLCVILLCILIASWMAYWFSAGGNIIAGSFLGAALSLLVNWLVTELETAKRDDVPEAFYIAGSADAVLSGYYRKDQELEISFFQENGDEFIQLHFSAIIIPVRPASVEYPAIQPPAGLERVAHREFYKIDGNPVSPDFPVEVSKEARDELQVVYKILDRSALEFRDKHLWPSPVLSYRIRCNKGGGHLYGVGRVIAGSKSRSLRISHQENSVIFSSDAPAFTTQGIEWRIRKSSGGASIEGVAGTTSFPPDDLGARA
jgi:hypothetical protein